jgi:hypothetical protein
MYRIELAPNEETVFRTIEELATAVRNGLVGPRSRIYHNASQKWLPIEFHPHYKKIMENPTAKTIELPVAPAPVEVPLVVPSPVLELPKISYPEPKPAEARVPAFLAMAPAVEMPKLPVVTPEELESPGWTESPDTVIELAAESDAPARGRRVKLAVGALAVLAVGYGLFAAFAPTRGEAAGESRETVAERPVVPRAAAARESSNVPSAAPAAPRPPAPSSLSAGFAPEMPGRTGAHVAAGSAATPVSTDTSAIAPAPAAVDLALPSLPRADSLVVTPRNRSDSAAMKQILRAVSGEKAPPAR